MRPVSCPSDLALEQYLLGELAQGQSHVGDHVNACATCRTKVADKAADDVAFASSPGAAAVKRALSARATPVRPTATPPPARTLPTRTRESRRLRVLAALGVAAALSLVVLLTLRSPSFMPSSRLTRAMPGDEQIVLRVQREWMEAVRDKDAAALDRILADDYVYTDSAGGVTYKADSLRQARSSDGKMKAFHTSDEEARVFGDVAVVTGRLRVEGVSRGGQAYDVEVRFTDILARIGGQWRAVAAHASKPSENRPPSP